MTMINIKIHEIPIKYWLFEEYLIWLLLESFHRTSPGRTDHDLGQSQVTFSYSNKSQLSKV